MHQERIWTLLSRKLSGEATSAELFELESLLEANPGINLPVEMAEEYWNIPAEADEDFLEATYHLHTQRLKNLGHDLEVSKTEDAGLLNIEESGFVSRKRILWGSGVLAAVALVFILVFSRGTKMAATGAAETAASEVSTKNGSRTKIMLPDGTQVWLNSDSRLVYDNEHFGDGTKEIREVSLTGEAYFDVVKNPARPFIIHTDKINIKVLGTAFNVKAYPEDKQTETSLIRGKIEVTIKNRPNDKIILSPNEKLVVENNEIINRKTKALPASGRTEMVADTVPSQVSINKLVYSPLDNSIAETGWVYNRLVFRDETFEDVALKMERWYNTEIEIQGEALKQLHLNGSFANESVTQALDALKISFAFKYRREGQKIIIYH